MGALMFVSFNATLGMFVQEILRRKGNITNRTVDDIRTFMFLQMLHQTCVNQKFLIAILTDARLVSVDLFVIPEISILRKLSTAY